MAMEQDGSAAYAPENRNKTWDGNENAFIFMRFEGHV